MVKDSISTKSFYFTSHQIAIRNLFSILYSQVRTFDEKEEDRRNFYALKNILGSMDYNVNSVIDVLCLPMQTQFLRIQNVDMQANQLSR